MLKQHKEWVDSRPPMNYEYSMPLAYSALGMVSEMGEAGDVIKKILRGNKIDPVDFVLELGDSLYYAQKILTELGFTLEQVLEYNIKKLDLRDELGKEQGNIALKKWIASIA